MTTKIYSQCMILFYWCVLSACSSNTVRPDVEPIVSTPEPLSSPIADEIQARDHPTKTTFTTIDTQSSKVYLLPKKSTPQNLWSMIATSFTFSQQPHPHPEIARELQQLMRHPEYFKTMQKSAAYSLYYIYSEIESRRLPTELALLPIIESRYQPFAQSLRDASGLWQIIGSTGKALGLQQDWWYDGRRDIQRSTQAALSYLVALNQRYHGDWLLTLAAYNAGIGTVNRAIRENKRLNKPTDFWSLPLPRETQRYVPKLLAVAQYISQPDVQTDNIIPNYPFFIDIPINQPLDLAKAASYAEEDIELLYYLNPGFKRWTTPPNGPHALLIPYRAKNIFFSHLTQHPSSDWLTFTEHKIKAGETLSHIAKRHHVSVQMIEQSNALNTQTVIHKGQTLRIPVPSQKPAYYALSESQRGYRVRKKIYTVQPGDSLWKIARQHGVEIKSLLAWNDMRDETVQVGKTLVVWPSKYQDKRPMNYTVRQGDSLARISKKFRVSISSLRKWNTLRKGKYIYPGQQLTVYLNI